MKLQAHSDGFHKLQSCMLFLLPVTTSLHSLRSYELAPSLILAMILPGGKLSKSIGAHVTVSSTGCHALLLLRLLCCEAGKSAGSGAKALRGLLKQLLQCVVQAQDLDATKPGCFS